jgi:hypothetical protein
MRRKKAGATSAAMFLVLSALGGAVTAISAGNALAQSTTTGTRAGPAAAPVGPPPDSVAPAPQAPVVNPSTPYTTPPPGETPVPSR